jgi:sugar phosphate isomerase/epimerase
MGGLPDMFKFSFNSTTLRNMDVIEALNNIKSYGYDGVELSLNDTHIHPLKSNSKLSEVKNYCKENDLPIVCIAAGGDSLLSNEPYEPSLISPEREGRAKRLDLIKRSMELTAYLEAPILNINSGKLKAGVSKGQAFEYLHENFETLLSYNSQVTLVLEPEPDFLIGTSTVAINLIQKINHPRLKLNLDIGHVFCSEDAPYYAIERAMPYTRNIHIEDIKNRIHHHEIPGEGDIDFVKVIETLKKSGYSHYVSVELHHHADMWQRALKESLEYLSKLM